MDWQTNLTLMVRVLINDLALPQKNTDDYLQQVIVTAGIIVDPEITFPFDYSYDIEAVTITPDPVVKNDIFFQSLVPLKAACIITQGNFQTALGQGIKVRDGDSAIDTTVGFRGYRDIITLGPCLSYENLKWKIESSRSRSVGSAVMTPFREPDIQSPISDMNSFFDSMAVFLNRSGRRI